ncbi:cytochrome oxidase subunit III [Aquimarina sp. AD10]|uniref:Cytochrome oxidase subunit III n=1 Tax=Aquimarina aggregata TaxID=1642818 RepID=A0A162YQA9_9FLAO|nr:MULTISPECIES: cytochrome c oxidase subunit 3 [Aquimarina]AXT61186.1 cytochrome oxidase subunit III [Aquimarina sp. AD10]KZS39281.1 cytochrome oxidase subunit III [Aquimarina aggregata]RKN02198.1 cytochrome oxidase subunit III [Aquimarina sp. AD10]
MDTAVAKTGTEDKTWGGGNEPLKASYGKMMMWFFIVSDALTFSGFLAAYGFSRFKFIDSWPIADQVFNHFPFLHGVDAPMYYVALMTFILIFSSVTMVLAVDAGHHMKQKKVIFYMFLTIIGGAIFVGSQAWEWKNFIKGEYGAIETKGGQILQFVDTDGHRVALADIAIFDAHKNRVQHENKNGIWYENEATLPTYTIDEIRKGFAKRNDVVIRTQVLTEKGEKTILSREESLKRLQNDAIGIVEGANLVHNEYGTPLFANFFFFITGFHGFHVLSGVIINIIIFINVILGTYEKRKNYEMVEKVGLYWHFVDLVWVFVFTFFYLV